MDSKYLLGDLVVAVCVIPLSKPPANLSWYINSDSADVSFVFNQSERRIGGTDTALYSVLQLEFMLMKKHLLYPGGGFSLKCTAEIENLYWKSTEVVTSVAFPLTSWLKPASARAFSSQKCSSMLVIVFLVVSFILKIYE